MSVKAHLARASVLAVALATTAPVLAQTTPSTDIQTNVQSDGGINGVVTDDTGQERLEGAIIRIEELGRETATDSEGRFGFANVPDGTYTVTATYFGGDPFQGTVTVSGGRAPELTLAPAAGEIVVFGVRGNISASRSRERAADVLQSVVSSDAAGEFGDQNLAESLQRVPGVSIIRSEGEGTTVSIRGLAPQFTKVTIDGVQLGATGDGREASLDTISSDLASAITVSKYQLPDQPADAIGGTVNIEGLSAFDQGGFTLNLRAEGSYQEEADEISPIVSASTTFLTGLFGGEDNLGISLAANYSRRRISVDVIDGDAPPYLYQDAAGDVGYVPDKIILQREIATRERFGLSGGLEFRPSDEDQLFLRGTWAENRDLDQAMIEEWDIDDAQGGTRGTPAEVLDISGDSFVLADANVLVEMSHQPEIDRLYTLTFGGEHTRGNWVLDYQGYFSHRKIFKDNFIKGEWREQNVIVAGSTSADDYDIRAISRAEAQALLGLPSSQPPSGVSNGNAYVPSNYDQIQVQTEDGLRDDKVWSLQANLRRNFVTGAGRDGYLKAGASYLDRSQVRDRDRRNYNPTLATDRARICGTNAACLAAIGSTLAQFDLGIPQNSILSIPFPTFAEVVPFFNNQAEQYLDLATAGTSRDDVLTTGDDYDARERIYAGYVMGQVGLTENITVTGGVRVEHTEFSSNGYLTINNETDVLEGDPFALVFTAELPEATKSYTDFFPSLLVRFEPVRDVVIRAAYSTSTQRASFNQTRNSIVSEDDFATDDSGTADPSDDVFSSELTLGIGRPDLDPYSAQNFDLSAAFYPNSSTVLSIAGFYKQIKDFIVPAEFTNVTLAELGFANLPSVGQFSFDPNATYSTIETTINGDSATVYGVEFDFAHTFNWLPGPLENLFVQGNATFVHSESTIELLRGDDVLPLVGQADIVANLSLGYEDDTFTARVSGNYSGERLAELGSNIGLAQQLDQDSEFDRYGDLYIEEYFSIDASLRVRLNRRIQLSFDAINLNRESDDINYKRSNRDYFAEREIFGRTFKAGVRVSF